jgi:hypothetical protein
MKKIPHRTTAQQQQQQPARVSKRAVQRSEAPQDRLLQGTVSAKERGRAAVGGGRHREAGVLVRGVFVMVMVVKGRRRRLILGGQWCTGMVGATTMMIHMMGCISKSVGEVVAPRLPGHVGSW